MKQPHKKPAKKSETLEVRLSHPDKVALQDKAARDGRTVSDVVRGLISSYLSQAEPRSKPSHLTELLMKLKSRPKSTFAALISLPILITPFLIPTAASAKEISLSLKGEFVASIQENGEPGQRVRQFNTEIHIDSDQFMTMRLPSLSGQGPKTGLYMALHVYETENQVILDLTLCEVANAPQRTKNIVEMIPKDICETANIIANPTLKTGFGDQVEFKMGDIAGETFSFRAIPNRL